MKQTELDVARNATGSFFGKNITILIIYTVICITKNSVSSIQLYLVSLLNLRIVHYSDKT